MFKIYNLAQVHGGELRDKFAPHFLEIIKRRVGPSPQARQQHRCAAEDAVHRGAVTGNDRRSTAWQRGDNRSTLGAYLFIHLSQYPKDLRGPLRMLQGRYMLVIQGDKGSSQ